ncbi:hypothetical protein XM53_02800 [Roseovarius atlanticus]|uniref:Uncharacterized protein n=1 Tax=Roseovarius atlanticus TaxID=1641875 RepID=A0A0T5P0I8_9RHOB|nr:hypothetical protein [Roseovarius atlanticus]KRS14648.1 hypothetical protein XM53_02800 [Roseovarius atlanticus]
MLAFVLALVVIVAVGLSLGRGRMGGRLGGPGNKPAKRACKWSETGNSNGRFVEYRCASCGVAAYSATGDAPVICKSNLKGSA